MRRQKKFKHTDRWRHRSVIIGFVIGCVLTAFCPAASWAVTARDKYHLAEACYKDLRNRQSKQKYRHHWLGCIRKFQEVYKHDPSGPWAAAGLYNAAVLYQSLYKRSGRRADELEALDAYQRIVKRFPNSRYRSKAAAGIASISKKNYQKPIQKPKRPEKNNRTETATRSQKPVFRKPTPPSSTTIAGLRYWSNPNYTRLVIDANNETTYVHRLLKKDPAIDKPQRLYVDLDNSMLGKDAPKIIPINDELLMEARAGQHTPDSVRVVVDIKSFTTYKIFSLKNPFRIVLDVWGSTPKQPNTTAQLETPFSDIPDGALAKQLALGVRRIVIDPGHGGRDYGAPGYIKGTHEKYVALNIAKTLAQKIRKELACEVILTRSTDRYLTLEERTAIANTKSADLFISIHTNASRNRRAFGIETYFLNLATDEDAIRVAARENATSTKNISDLQTILNDLMQNAKINESSRLATHVQTSLYGQMRKSYSRIRNLGVKQAPFYVLLGAQMPSILIETSFISNPRECKRLMNSKYINGLCRGIIKGVRAYMRETNPLALSN